MNGDKQMKLDYNLNLTQEQKLIMTQSMQLSIKLLQMSTMELKEYIDKEFAENPTLEIKDGALEDGYEIIKVNKPVVLTAIKELNEPRYMHAALIFESANKEIRIMTADEMDVDKKELGLSGSPTKVKKSMTKEAKGQGEIVNLPPQEAASYLLKKMKERHYI